MPTLKEMFPSKYVTGGDLGGRSFPVTIARVQAEKMRASAGSAEETGWVLYFAESKTGKGIVLRRTLAGQIARALGSEDTDEWTGKKIVIYPEAVTVAGVPRVAIRARVYTNGNGAKQE
jgi:hypothetical protein